MNLKKYNESTGTWDIISSGNASGIMVTDPHFLEEGQTFKSVNQVLVDMDDKVEETKRNLSWVVLNGTIGVEEAVGELLLLSSLLTAVSLLLKAYITLFYFY